MTTTINKTNYVSVFQGLQLEGVLCFEKTEHGEFKFWGDLDSVTLTRDQFRALGQEIIDTANQP